MAFKSNEIKAGVIIISGLLILVLFLVAIFGVNFGKDTKVYYTHLEYVGGLSEGSLVKFRGFNVGQVSEIVLPTLTEPNIGIALEIESETPVRTDSRAFISSIGMMSEQHLEISAGSVSADMLPPNSEIPGKEVLSFAQMAETMGELSAHTQDLILRVSDLLNDNNRAYIASIMENTDGLVKDGRDPFRETSANLATMSHELANISRDLASITDPEAGKIDAVLSNLQTTTENATKLVGELNETLKNFQTVMSSNNRNIREITNNFETVSQNFEEFSRMIKEQPWLLVRKSAPPERKIK